MFCEFSLKTGRTGFILDERIQMNKISRSSIITNNQILVVISDDILNFVSSLILAWVHIENLHKRHFLILLV